MTWILVGRLLAGDARRSKGLWSVIGLFVGVAVGAVLIPAIVFEGSLSASSALGFLVAPLRLAVGLTGLLAGYGAIAGPRAGGQLKLVLGLPVHRTALVVGAFVGRGVVVGGGVGIGIGVVAVVLPMTFGSLPAWRLVGFGGLLFVLALAMTAIGVGLSAAMATPGRAAVAAVAVFVGFEFFWGVVPAGLHYLVEGTMPGAVVPAWLVMVERLQPFSAFEAATTLVLPSLDVGVHLAAGGAEPTTPTGHRPLADRIEGPVPRYLNPWAAVVTLVGWIVIPLVVGGYRFRSADL